MIYQNTHTMTHTISETIFNQLGGNRFSFMTGCKWHRSYENGILIKLTRNNSKAQFLEIRLNGNDLYDMNFFKVNRNTLDWITTSKQTDVFCDQLASIFESVTHLYTKL